MANAFKPEDDSNYDCSMENRIMINHVDKVEKGLKQQRKHLTSTLKAASIWLSQAKCAMPSDKKDVENKKRELKIAALKVERMKDNLRDLNKELCRIQDWRKVGENMKLWVFPDSLSEEDA